MKLSLNAGATLLALVALTVFVNGQQTKGTEKSNVAGSFVSSTPAFAEVLLKRTEIEAELESLLLDYTDEYPRIKELRFSLGIVQKEQERIFNTNSGEVSKLSYALGKLIVGKIEAESELWRTQQGRSADSREVKRAEKKAEIFERAIKQILG